MITETMLAQQDARVLRWERVISAPARALHAGLANGGATVALDGSTVPTTGYVVGVPHLGTRFDAVPTVEAVDAWLQSVPTYEKTTGRYVGSWVDGETGSTYLDVVDIVDSRGAALALAVARHELAVWDIANGVEIRAHASGRAS